MSTIFECGEIAHGLSPLDSTLALRHAGRLLLTEARRNISCGTTFAIESTLSGTAQARIMRIAKQQGYHVSVFYFGLGNVEMSEVRVRLRVEEGGHDVPQVGHSATVSAILAKLQQRLSAPGG
jgi:predicted ABC-type ATPase